MLIRCELFEFSLSILSVRIRITYTQPTNDRWIEWYRCIFALKKVYGNLAGEESHARDRSMVKMGVNDCLWWCRDVGERERVVFGVNGLVMSLKYCQLAWFEEDTEKVEYLRRNWIDFETPQNAITIKKERMSSNIEFVNTALNGGFLSGFVEASVEKPADGRNGECIVHYSGQHSGYVMKVKLVRVVFQNRSISF